MFKRFLGSQIDSSLNTFPVTFINGARQVGKTTLAKMFDKEYITFDNLLTLSTAKGDPVGFINQYSNGATIDEIQKYPDILYPIKMNIDNDRKAGKFILTGSSNILATPKIADALCGRMSILNLYPLSIQEIYDQKFDWIDLITENPNVLEIFKNRKPKIFNKILLMEHVRRGGYPEIIKITDHVNFRGWFDSYITSLIQKDLADVSQVSDISALLHLLKVLSNRIATCVNKSELARQVGLPLMTLKRYMIVLEMLFLTYNLNPWFNNREKRLIKTPKLFFVDSGLAHNLIGADIISSQNTFNQGLLIENFVITEILKQISWSKNKPAVSFFRTSDGREVDLILELTNGKTIAIEIKSSESVSSNDFKGIKAFKEVSKRDTIGFVLYSGNQIGTFGNDMWAIPISCIL